MLKHRLISGFSIAIALVAAALFLPAWAVLVVLLLLCAALMMEFYGLLTAADIPNFNIIGTISGVALTLISWYELQAGTPPGEYERFLFFIVATTILLRQFPQKHNQRPLETMGGTLLGLMYIGFFFSFFARLIFTWGLEPGRFMILYLVLVVKISDIGAYFTGSCLGRHKLFPRLSPKKTWEGYMGGLAASALASVGWWWVTKGTLAGLPFGVVDALILGILLASMGLLGDLVESLMKRAAGVKDSSSLIAGMGGLLDVLDSLLLTAPVLYMYIRIFMK